MGKGEPVTSMMISPPTRALLHLPANLEGRGAHSPSFPTFDFSQGAQQMLEYLNSYAEVFNLRPHIQFRTKVLMCLPKINPVATAPGSVFFDPHVDPSTRHPVATANLCAFSVFSVPLW
jgi:hypothetical protein